MTNRLNVVLAAATLVLAAVTMHYALAARQLRARNDQIHSAVDGQRQHAPPAVRSTATTSIEYSPDTPAGKKPPAPGQRLDPLTIKVYEYFLNRLREPDGRALKIKELVQEIREEYKDVARYIGMSPDELDRFVRAIAEQRLERNIRDWECLLDPGCNRDALSHSEMASHERLEADLLGPEKTARLKAFNDSGDERQLVHVLQLTLPASSALTEAQADRLALALYDESQRLEAEAKQRGQETPFRVAYSNQRIEILDGAYIPNTPDDIQKQEQSVKRFSQRLYAQAATTLTATQLAGFKALQDRFVSDYMQNLNDLLVEANASKDVQP